MDEYDWNEIKLHNKKDDCWIVANNKVYDVTSLINKHPGGTNSIIKNAGKDCTRDYDFHSKISRKIWKKYQIGIIKNSKKKSFCCIF